MNNLIQKIEIFNFRSIQHVTIDCTEYNLFCGRNDAGKSNVLKALNLFFNQQTDFHTPFNFETDYNKSELSKAQTSKKKKQQIRIKITFKVPSGYKSIPGGSFCVEKRYDRYTKNGPAAVEDFVKGGKIIKTGISRILNSIEYFYLPALKGNDIIQYVLGIIGESNIAKISQIDDINKAINGSTKDIVTFLEASKLLFGATFTLPKLVNDFWQQILVGTEYEYTKKLEENLRELQHRDIKLNPATYRIPLQIRGDGLKSRFIPPMLLWLQKNNPRKIFIWGVDEPENSLEFRAADELSSLYTDEYATRVQIFATSHSMAFINPKPSAKIVPSIFRTQKTENGQTEFYNINDLLHNESRIDLLEELGSLALQKELIDSFRSKMKEQADRYNDVISSIKTIRGQMEKIQRPLVITEGKTDIIHIEKARKQLGLPSHYDILETQYQPTGDGDLLTLLKYLARTPQAHKIIGIFDCDSETTNDICSPFKDFGHNVYAFKIESPKCRVANNQTKISIEYLYTNDEIHTELPNHTRLFFGTEFSVRTGRCKTDDSLSLANQSGRGKDKIIENEGGQAVYDSEENNYLAKKTDFADAVTNDKVPISKESWENFRHIFDKIEEIINLE